MRDAAHLAATVVGWRAIDAARTLRTRLDAAYVASRGMLRLPNLTRTGDTCIVIVNLTMRRDLSLDSLIVARPDASR